MNIIVRGGVTLSVLRDDLDYTFIGNLTPDMICGFKFISFGYKYKRNILI
jgi:hypothetical protein